MMLAPLPVGTKIGHGHPCVLCLPGEWPLQDGEAQLAETLPIPLLSNLVKSCASAIYHCGLVLRFGEQPPFATLGAFSISVGSCGSLPSQDGPKTSLQACLHPLPSLLQGVDGFCSFFLFPSHRCLFLPWWLRW